MDDTPENIEELFSKLPTVNKDEQIRMDALHAAIHFPVDGGMEFVTDQIIKRASAFEDFIKNGKKEQ